MQQGLSKLSCLSYSLGVHWVHQEKRLLCKASSTWLLIEYFVQPSFETQARRASAVLHGRPFSCSSSSHCWKLFSFNFPLISSHNSGSMALMAQQCSPKSQSWSFILQFYCLFIINNLQNSLRRYSSCQSEKTRDFHALAL